MSASDEGSLVDDDDVEVVKTGECNPLHDIDKLLDQANTEERQDFIDGLSTERRTRLIEVLNDYQVLLGEDSLTTVSSEEAAENYMKFVENLMAAGEQLCIDTGGSIASRGSNTVIRLSNVITKLQIRLQQLHQENDVLSRTIEENAEEQASSNNEIIGVKNIAEMTKACKVVLEDEIDVLKSQVHRPEESSAQEVNSVITQILAEREKMENDYQACRRELYFASEKLKEYGVLQLSIEEKDKRIEELERKIGCITLSAAANDDRARKFEIERDQALKYSQRLLEDNTVLQGASTERNTALDAIKSENTALRRQIEDLNTAAEEKYNLVKQTAEQLDERNLELLQDLQEKQHEIETLDQLLKEEADKRRAAEASELPVPAPRSTSVHISIMSILQAVRTQLRNETYNTDIGYASLSNDENSRAHHGTNNLEDHEMILAASEISLLTTSLINSKQDLIQTLDQAQQAGHVMSQTIERLQGENFTLRNRTMGSARAPQRLMQQD